MTHLAGKEAPICNLYTTRASAAEVAALFKAKLPAQTNAGPGDVYPGYTGMVVRPDGAELVVEGMTWGFPLRLKGMKPGSKPKPINNARADNWQAAMDATDQLVITMSARNDSAETAARLLDHLEQTGRRELVRRAVTVMTMPPHRGDVDPQSLEEHFDMRCRAVLRVPYDRHLDTGSPVDYTQLSAESRRAWLRVAAAVAEGL